MGKPAPAQGLMTLTRARAALYESWAQEVEIRSAILAISLDDAFEENGRGSPETAWRLMELASGEWAGLAELNDALHDLVLRYLPVLEWVYPLGHLAGRHFRSSLMDDFARLQEVLEQFVFPSRLRFQLRLRVLRQAANALTSDFNASCSGMAPAVPAFPEIWKRAETDFHDFDLILKETLLAFRAFLAGVAEKELENLKTDLKAVPGRGERSTPLPAKDR